MSRRELEHLASDASVAMKRADEAEKAGEFIKALAILEANTITTRARLESMARAEWEAERRAYLSAEGEDDARD